MLISFQPYLVQTSIPKKKLQIKQSQQVCPQEENQNSYTKIPLSTLQTVNNVKFTGSEKPIPEINPQSYLKFSEEDKAWLRQKCSDFGVVDKPKGLEADAKTYIPLDSHKVLDEFVEFSKEYNSLKGTPTVCLGRSPKWMLDTSLWMKDGIEEYKQVLFSGSWYEPENWWSDKGGMVKKPEAVPTESQESAYKAYLNSIKSDPKHIIDEAQKAGKKVVITDYIQKAKGMMSFLDLISRYAESQGVLNKFADSIKFLTIISREYTESFYPGDEPISMPSVILPETLKKIDHPNRYDSLIREDSIDMPEGAFNEIILNKNANECLPSYYSKSCWTEFNPSINPPKLSQALNDYRNLLSFRILDHLNARNLLKLV